MQMHKHNWHYTGFDTMGITDTAHLALQAHEHNWRNRQINTIGITDTLAQKALQTH